LDRVAFQRQTVSSQGAGLEVHRVEIGDLLQV